MTYDLLAPATSWVFGDPDTKSKIVVPINSRLSVSTSSAAIDAAAAGVASFEPEQLPYHIVHAQRGLLPLKMRSFLDFAVPRLRTALSPFQKRD